MHSGDKLLEKSQTKQCRECSVEIPRSARKCKICGSFQDYRRFASISQSSVAFFLALIALFAHFAPGIRASLIDIQDRMSGTNFSMSAGLVAIDYQKLTAILNSRRNYSFAVSNIICMINLPADKSLFALNSIKRNDTAWDGSADPMRRKQEWMGPILIAYEFEEPQFFEPFEARMVAFEYAYTGFPFTQISIHDDAPRSFCTVSGVGQDNEIVAAPFIVSDISLVKFDSLSILEKFTDADSYSGGKEMHLKLIQKIQLLRNPMSNSP